MSLVILLWEWDEVDGAETAGLGRVYYDRGNGDLQIVEGDEKLTFHTTEFPE